MSVVLIQSIIFFFNFLIFPLFLSSVVIDHSKNPVAPTGKFECIYHQTVTRIRRYHPKTLEVIGSAIHPHYFYGEGKGPEEMFCNSAEPKRLSLSNIPDKLDSDDICLDIDDNKSKETRTYTTKIESDIKTELNYNKPLDVNTVPELCFTEIDSEALPEPDYRDCFNDKPHMKTNSSIKRTEPEDRTESNYVDSLNANSVLDTGTNNTKRELNAMTTPDYTHYFDAKSNVETTNINLDLKTKLVNGDCLHATSDVERNSQYVILWTLIEIWRQAATYWFIINICNNLKNL